MAYGDRVSSRDLDFGLFDSSNFAHSTSLRAIFASAGHSTDFDDYTIAAFSEVNGAFLSFYSLSSEFEPTDIADSPFFPGVIEDIAVEGVDIYELWNLERLFPRSTTQNNRIFQIQVRRITDDWRLQRRINLSIFNSIENTQSNIYYFATSNNKIWVYGFPFNNGALGLYVYNNDGTRDSSSDVLIPNTVINPANVKAFKVNNEGTRGFFDIGSGLRAIDLSNGNRLPNYDMTWPEALVGGASVNGICTDNSILWKQHPTNYSMSAFDFTQVAAGPPIRKSTDLVKRFCGSQAIQKYYLGSRLVWEQGTPPAITSLSASPSSIDLDTRASGNVTVNFGVTNSTHNRLYNTRTGANVPLTTSTTAVFAQPQQPTTYRLLCQNAVGSISRDVSIDVTKNASIANFRRTGFLRHILGGGTSTYRFGATIEGLPMPVVRYRFSTGEQGVVAARHLRQGANPYTWIMDWSIVLNSNAARSLVLTATNTSNTATQTISNINA